MWSIARPSRQPQRRAQNTFCVARRLVPMMWLQRMSECFEDEAAIKQKHWLPFHQLFKHSTDILVLIVIECAGEKPRKSAKALGSLLIDNSGMVLMFWFSWISECINKQSGGFFLTCKDLGKMLDHSLPVLFFSFFCLFSFLLKWTLARAHQFPSLCQDQSTVAQ